MYLKSTSVTITVSIHTKFNSISPSGVRFLYSRTKEWDDFPNGRWGNSSSLLSESCPTIISSISELAGSRRDCE